MDLSIKQKQHLKGLVHLLKPAVPLGSNGLTEGVLAEIEQALKHHELVKVKTATEDCEIKTLIMEATVRGTGACNVQVIGEMLVLHRPAKEHKIPLPRQDYPKVTHIRCVKRGVFHRQESKMSRLVR